MLSPRVSGEGHSACCRTGHGGAMAHDAIGLSFSLRRGKRTDWQLHFCFLGRMYLVALSTVDVRENMIHVAYVLEVPVPQVVQEVVQVPKVVPQVERIMTRFCGDDESPSRRSPSPQGYAVRREGNILLPGTCD
eukprot:5164787-Amphidinium_carterae.1